VRNPFIIGQYGSGQLFSIKGYIFPCSGGILVASWIFLVKLPKNNEIPDF